MLFQNDDLGKDMTRGLSRARRGPGPRRSWRREPYDFAASDVASQIAKLKASGADTLMLFATPIFFLRAIAETHKLGWKPQVYIASVSIEPTIMTSARLTAPELTKGALSIAFVKNPNDPIWNADPVMALYRKVMQTYLPEGKPSDVYNFYGMTVAWTMVDTLERAGQETDARRPARGRRSVSTRRRTRSCCLASGSRRPTRDYFPLATVYLYRYDNRQWVQGERPAARTMTACKDSQPVQHPHV